MTRNKIIISGYYGYDNLGDEAILEELIKELCTLVKPEDITVLSADPEKTKELFKVNALARKSLGLLWSALAEARLFISGGGGLFQNSKTLGSILYYGLQILMARAYSVKVLVWAQGLGPFRGKLAENLCRSFISNADAISVRDDRSMTYLKDWQLAGTRSADPVWMLEPSPLDPETEAQLRRLGAGPESESSCVGVSLRPSKELCNEHLQNLALALDQNLEPQMSILLLPLQPEQDLPLLQEFQSCFQSGNRKIEILRGGGLKLPSQWLSLFSRLNFLVGMRLHALIMALKCGRPVAGIAYDPKVTQLLAEFEQCLLILTKESAGKDWSLAIKDALTGLESHSLKAREKAEAAKNLACQNFQILARILDMPRE